MRHVEAPIEERAASGGKDRDTVSPDVKEVLHMLSVLERRGRNGGSRS